MCCWIPIVEVEWLSSESFKSAKSVFIYIAQYHRSQFAQGALQSAQHATPSVL